MARHGNSTPRGGRSFGSVYPDIAELWHPEKNGNLTPFDVAPKSNKKFWFFCPESNCKHPHEWKAPPANLAQTFEKRGSTGCPYCSHRRFCSCNSLGGLYKDIAELWDPEKNGDLTPFDVSPQSNRRIWWKCPEGPDHEWQATVASRYAGVGCPCCSKPPKQISVTNCMKTMRPEVVPYWHEELNGEVTPRDIFPGSSTKYWWKCPEGPDHVWEATPEAIGSALSSRFQGIGCPFCKGRKLSVTNRLDVLFPELSKEWHPELNGDMVPSDITSANDHRAWWICPEGPDHEWQAAIHSRTRGTGCPFCSGHQVSVTNRLSVLLPELASQWHPTKNGEDKPEDFPSKAKKRVWWKCPKGADHEWEAPIYSRAIGRGCPFCANRKGSGNATAVSVTNRLSNIFPEIAKQWHPTKNGDSSPDDFVFGSHTKVWWLCSNDSSHEWKTKIHHRTMRNSGCPSCAKYGIDISKPTQFYVMRIENQIGIWWWKAGISVNPERRARQIQSSLESSGMLLDVVVHESIDFETGSEALEFEKLLLDNDEIRATTSEVFSGCTELFSVNPLRYTATH